MPITKRQLAASVALTAHISDRETMAAFILDEATKFGANPFAATTAGAVQQVWGKRAFEFRVMGVHAIGLSNLLEVVSTLGTDERLSQEILRSGPHTLHVLHFGDGCRIAGVVLYGKAGNPLPMFGKHRSGLSRRKLRYHGQLDLFTAICAG